MKYPRFIRTWAQRQLERMLPSAKADLDDARAGLARWGFCRRRLAMSDDNYTAATTWEAECARVAVVVCLRCGAAILLDPRESFSAKQRHDDWHAQQPAPLPPEVE